MLSDVTGFGLYEMIPSEKSHIFSRPFIQFIHLLGVYVPGTSYAMMTKIIPTFCQLSVN